MPRFFGGFLEVSKSPIQPSLNPNDDHLPPKGEHLSPKIDHHQQLMNVFSKINHSLPKMVIYGRGGVKPILAMPRFSRRLFRSPLPYKDGNIRLYFFLLKLGVGGGGHSYLIGSTVQPNWRDQQMAIFWQIGVKFLQGEKG